MSWRPHVARRDNNTPMHDDVIKWKHFPRYWPFVRGIHRSPVNSPHKGQWRGALMFSLICVWKNAWVNNREAGDLRRYRSHYDVIVMDHSQKQKGRHCLQRRLSLWPLPVQPMTVNLSPWHLSISAMACLLSRSKWLYKQRVLMHRHQGLNVRHGLCHIYMRYLYIYELFIAFVCFVVCSLL